MTGGANNSGVLFKIKPDGSGFTKLLDFNGANGSGPHGSLYFDGTFLYGMTSNGGGGYGTIFKIKPDGTGYLNLNNFSPPVMEPFGSLISDGTFLYGMSYLTSDIFKIKPDGTGFTILKTLSGTDGFDPYGDLILIGNVLYGMTAQTYQGGTNNEGNMFKINTDGTGFTNLMYFSSSTGYNPWGNLISDGTSLYGLTTSGGTNNQGTIFKFGISTGTNIADNNGATDITIYPNPSSGIFNLQMTTFENAQINIYNLLGECVYQNMSTSSNFNIDLSSQAEGVYFISVQTNEGTVNKKIVISK